SGRTFTFVASQRIFDHVVNTQSPLRIRGDVVLALQTPEPADGTTWTVTTTPERTLPGGSAAAIEPTAENAEAAGASSIGNRGALFGQRNVIFSPTVDLVSAVRTTPVRATQAVAVTSPAMNRAADGMMGAAGPLYSLFQDQAISASGSVLGVA